jgi:hypothetical protein
LRIEGCEIGGSIQYFSGGDITVLTTSVIGSIQVESNDGSVLLQGNTVDADVQVSQNTGGPFQISENEIDGNLQCQSNDPSPQGSGNIVMGDKEYQCSGL